MNTAILRIIDVCINRSREALRVIEDYARFVLDDADAAGAAKRCRHSLATIAEAVGGAAALLDARDIDSDVGRALKTDAEIARPDADAVLAAAFARLQESSRSLAEYAKLAAPRAAAVAERIRYQAYGLEPTIRTRGVLRRRFRELRLYVLLSEALCRHDWRSTLDEVLSGGAQCVQLREKHLSDRELLSRARLAREATAARGALLAINDRPDIARLVGADIVHIGQDDMSVAQARRIVGGAVLVGKSTHTPAQFDAALAEAPDYLAVGPMFPSRAKPQEHIAGPRTLAAVRARSTLPVVAIGGIDSDNVSEVLAAGADCIAVCLAVIADERPGDAARVLRAAIESARHGGMAPDVG